MSFRLVFLCLFHTLGVSLGYAQSPFVDGSEDILLELLDKVERELKVFVYSLDEIQGLRRCDMKYGGFTPVNNPATRSNFQQELDMPLFMQNHKSVRTLNPEEADYFLIVHEWICLRIGNEDTHYIVPEKAERYYHEHVLPLQKQQQQPQQGVRSLRNNNIPNRWTGEKIAQEHVWPIMNHVVNVHPYFNRSKGHDHFMMNLLDNGFQCGGGHIQSKSPAIIPIFELLENVTFIGNNGYSYEHDEGAAQYEHGYGKRCFNGKKDITIPQAHSWYQELSDEKRAQQAQLPLREGNIYFTGDVDIAEGSDCSPDARVRMASAISRLDNEINQNRNQAELEQLREKRRHIQFQAGQTQTSYFSLCPSRNACWSVRLYDALNHDSIPVILADQMIAPFERFLNWTTFTVKYITRNSTFEEHYIDDLTRFGNEARAFAAARSDTRVPNNENLPLVAKKLNAIRQVAPWLSFACPAQVKRCAYRLVLAELWCKTKKGSEHAACKRKSSFIAWREYL